MRGGGAEEAKLPSGAIRPFLIFDRSLFVGGYLISPSLVLGDSINFVLKIDRLLMLVERNCLFCINLLGKIICNEGFKNIKIATPT